MKKINKKMNPNHPCRKCVLDWYCLLTDEEKEKTKCSKNRPDVNS